MPLGIMSDEEFEKEVNLNKDKSIIKITNDVVKIEHKDITKSGRNEGDINKTESMREIIALCKINGDSDSEIKESFNTSSSSINAYSNGKNGTSNPTDDRLAHFVKAARNTITKKASRTLIKALDSITDVNISRLEADKISVLAKNMSSIITNMEEKNRNIVQGPSAQFIVFTPPQKNIDKYEVIEVNS